MHYTIVSDLHLGAGDEREDFLLWGNNLNGPSAAARAGAMEALDHAFARFLDSRLAEADNTGLRPHLLLLGDVVDLWQVRRSREPWADALVRILQSHPGFVSALRQWMAAGGQVTWVIGNHDQPVVDPGAWALVREVFSTINPTFGGAPTHFFVDHGAGLYAEHGHQWDPFNRLVKLDKPDADCLGFRIVRLLVNQLEPHFPLIDKGADLVTLLELLWEAALRADLPCFDELAPKLLRWVGRASRPACALLQELRAFLQEDRAPDFRRVGLEQSRAIEEGVRRAMDGRSGSLIGTAPQTLRFFSSGHTHIEGVRSVMTRQRGEVMHLNPGTWRPVVELAKGRGWRHSTVRQSPGAVVLAPVEGHWQASLRHAPISAPPRT